MTGQGATRRPVSAAVPMFQSSDFPPGLLAAHQIAALVGQGVIGHATPLAETPASI